MMPGPVLSMVSPLIDAFEVNVTPLSTSIMECP